jgi:hypothetical protein
MSEITKRVAECWSDRKAGLLVRNDSRQRAYQKILIAVLRDPAIDCINHSTSLRANVAQPIKALSFALWFLTEIERILRRRDFVK